MLNLTNAEIVSRLKLLSDYHLKADSGTLTTATINELKNEGSLAGYYICFLSGPNITVDRVVTDFYAETGILHFPSLEYEVDNTTEIALVKRGFQSDVAEAEKYITNHLRNLGLNIDLFLTTSQLREAHIFKTLELICGSLLNDGSDTDAYFVHYNRFKEMYENEISTLVADYDANEDGSIDESEENSNIGQASFVR